MYLICTESAIIYATFYTIRNNETGRERLGFDVVGHERKMVAVFVRYGVAEQLLPSVISVPRYLQRYDVACTVIP